MKTTVYSTILILTLYLSISSIYAQNLHFNYNDGSSATYNLLDVRKVTFNGNIMYLYLWDGSIYAWNVFEIENSVYLGTSSNVQSRLNDINTWNLSVFPNPILDLVNIKFQLPKADDITIQLYDSKGALLMVKKLGKLQPYEYQEILDLSNLSKGVYICQISGEKNWITKQILKQ